MSNLYYGTINTNNEYMDLANVTGLTFDTDTKYMIQSQGVITLYVGTSKPTEGGFTIYSNPIVMFELSTGENIYIKTYNNMNVPINIAS